MPDITVRLRHPSGVTTLSFDPSSTTIDDLRGLVFSATNISPDTQEIKYSYPPKPLHGSPTDKLSSIPITKGEQFIVSISSSPSAAGGSKASTPGPAPTPTPVVAPSIKHLNERLSAPSRLTPAPASQASTPALAPSPAPGSIAKSAHIAGKDEGARVELPGDAGSLELRKVPDDNSCLFSAIAVVFEGGIEGAGGLRKVVVDAIRKDPDTYSEVMLGKPVEEYISSISKPSTWGGAIEISIFSSHYSTEISSFDVQTGRCDRFGEGKYDNRCILIYSGIHYDALSLSPVPDAPPSFHTTVFPVHDESLLEAAGRLVKGLKDRHYYTDTASFDLRCGVCGEGLKGEKGAREHAMSTGHVEFGEY